MPSKDSVNGNTNPYIDLPYLDNIHQAYCSNGLVNKLKSPLRNAVNANRSNAGGMAELITLLEATLTFIKQIETKPVIRKKRVSKKKEEKEYDLP